MPNPLYTSNQKEFINQGQASSIIPHNLFSYYLYFLFT